MFLRTIISSTFSVVCLATVFDPSPAFPVPSWPNKGKNLVGPVFEKIQPKLVELINKEKYDAASFSIEVTSETDTILGGYHTARKRNETRPGVKRVDGDSLYRIASITKVFTVLGLLYQYEDGKVELDAPISKYIPELSGNIPFDDITVRILASQLSGIPRDFAQSDYINSENDPWKYGLPPASSDGLPTCDEYHDYVPSCTPRDLIEALKTRDPIFAPNQQSTYSNLNFELLGIVLERVTGKPFKDYMQEAIFEPLNMSSTTLDTPSDTHAVLPFGFNYWGIEEGVQNPTGGIYSSTTDMSKFLRYILTHYNAVATGINWLMPASWSTNMESFWGMPFEIFRIDEALKDSRRPVTFVTKSGGLPGYFSLMTVMPEYGLGLTVLVGCPNNNSKLLNEIQEIVSINLVQTAEELIWQEIDEKYSGQYKATDSNLNSSLELGSSPKGGLVLTSFISNGTDVFNSVLPGAVVDDSRPWRIQLVPTLLFKNETEQQGEIWRAIAAYERDPKFGIWDSFSVTDVDIYRYASRPLNEIVFWHNESIVELPAWKVKMKLSKSGAETLLVQE